MRNLLILLFSLSVLVSCDQNSSDSESTEAQTDDGLATPSETSANDVQPMNVPVVPVEDVARVDEADIPGMYRKEGNSDEYTSLKADGTFEVSEYGQKLEGTYEIKNGTVIMTLKDNFLGRSAEAHEGFLLDPRSQKWIKEE